jgi:aromatic ring-opening dioxygenase catalytic subunit (LigB family)
MSLSFACAMGHAPGILAWTDAAPAEQTKRLFTAFEELRRRLEQARLDALILFTAEHWANFFLDHMSAFCIGTAEHYSGPIEPWLKMEKCRIPGEPQLAEAILDACYAQDIELAFARELQLDHGTMIPLHFLTPQMQLPVVPILINTLAAPFPSARRCVALGRVVGKAARAASARIGIVATGGMSHDPGERNHGRIDSQFDRRFLDQMTRGDLDALGRYTSTELLAAGAGAVELLNWIALAAALQNDRGEVLAYESVQPWATGVGALAYPCA